MYAKFIDRYHIQAFKFPYNGKDEYGLSAEDKTALSNEGYLKVKQDYQFFKTFEQNNNTVYRAKYILGDGEILRQCEAVTNINEMSLFEKNQYRMILRRRRRRECFRYTDNEDFVAGLSAAQKSELEAWKQAWLDVTETLSVPTRPEWLV